MTCNAAICMQCMHAMLQLKSLQIEIRLLTANYYAMLPSEPFTGRVKLFQKNDILESPSSQNKKSLSRLLNWRMTKILFNRFSNILLFWCVAWCSFSTFLLWKWIFYFFSLQHIFFSFPTNSRLSNSNLKTNICSF